MEQIFATNWSIFIGMTIVIFGGASFLTGQALAKGWRPFWQCIVYGVLLGAANRFLIFALFEEHLAKNEQYIPKSALFCVQGFVLESVVLIMMALVAWRVTLVRMMVKQYPWENQADGLLSWKKKKTT